VLGLPWGPPGETVGAHVAAAAGRPLDQGDRVEVEGIEVEIESCEGGVITSVIVSPRARKEQLQ